MLVRTYAALLIDFDGTIVDSEPKHCAAHQLFLATQGIQVGDDVVYGNIGKSDRAFYLDLMAQHGKKGDVEAWMRRKTEILMDIYRREGLPLRPGLRQLLDHAWQEGICCCVVTSTERRLATLALEIVGLDRRLPARVCYEDTIPHKPDPAPYLLAASRLSVPIDRCLVIEDSVSGVTAGCAAGATTIGLVGLTSEAALFAAGASRCVRNLEELLPLSAQPGATSSFRRATRK